MLVNKSDLYQLIPQRPPIVMVDGLTEHCDTYSISIFKIEPENIFVINNMFQVPGLIENIAQTVALRSGYEYKLKIPASDAKPGDPPIGFIGEIKNLLISFLPASGSVLETRVELLHNIFGASVVKGQISCGSKIAAGCEMKLFVQNRALL